MSNNRKTAIAVAAGIYGGLVLLGSLLLARDGFTNTGAALFVTILGSATAGLIPLYAGRRKCCRCQAAE